MYAHILAGLATNLSATRSIDEEARRIAVERFSFSRMVDEHKALRGDIKA